jgi:hypothetical protein
MFLPLHNISCVIDFIHEHSSMNLVEFDNMNELTIWMELDHIVDLRHTIKIYNMVDSNAQRGETWKYE